MNRKKGYIFTNKQHTMWGVVSTTIGIMTIASNVYSIITSFQLRGHVSVRFGSALFVTAFCAIIGLICGVYAKMEKDKFYFFAYLGIILNVIALAFTSIVLYAGTYLI